MNKLDVLISEIAPVHAALSVLSLTMRPCLQTLPVSCATIEIFLSSDTSQTVA